MAEYSEKASWMGLGSEEIKLVIGIIGGVGAGKSTVLQILEETYHFQCFRTDDLAKSLYYKGSSVYQELVRILGRDILGEDGEIDRKKMASVIYRDLQKKNEVNALVHPAVWELVDRVIRECRKENQNICVETALPDSDFCKRCDEIWYVFTEQEERIKRLMKDRGYSREKAEAIIAAQPSEERYRTAADFILDNSGSKEETIHEIYKHCQRKQR